MLQVLDAAFLLFLGLLSKDERALEPILSRAGVACLTVVASFLKGSRGSRAVNTLGSIEKGKGRAGGGAGGKKDAAAGGVAKLVCFLLFLLKAIPEWRES
jgi:hypothetical protein